MSCSNCGVLFPPKKLAGPAYICDNCQLEQESDDLTRAFEDDKMDIESVLRKSSKTPAVRYD